LERLTVGDGVNSAPDSTQRSSAASPALIILAIVVLLAPVYLQRLGAADIVGDDEAREVGLIYDIVDRGRWILPRFNDTTLPDKPLLYHWLAAVACAATGDCDEHTVRLPAALSALALIALTGFAGWRMFDGPTGITAAALLGITPFLFERARTARPDTLVTLCLTAALLVSYAWYRDRGRSRPKATAIGVLLGFAVLAKGPVAPVVALTTIATFLVLRRDVGRGRWLLAPHVLIPLALLGGGWYIAALTAWGGAFAREHLIGRYLGNVFGGEFALGVQPSRSLLHHVSFYPLHLLLGTVPWTPLLVVAGVAIVRDPVRRADPRVQFLFLWAAAVVVVFSLAAVKLRHYLLPALPAIALLAAPFTSALVTTSSRTLTRSQAAEPVGASSHLRSLLLAVLAVALATGTAALWWWAGGVSSLSRSDRELARAIRTAVNTHVVWAALIAGGGALLAAGGVNAILRRRWRQLFGLGVAGLLAWMLAIQPSVQGALAARASLRSLGDQIRQEVPAGAPLYFFGTEIRSVVVYARRPIPSLPRSQSRSGPLPPYIIVTEAELPRLLRQALQIRTMGVHVGRTGNLSQGRVLLVEVSDPG
jgi:4-amino-4-deoxy-L-arabinose transferase-like glycosyltransferase